jgi:hypothetical protein
MISVGFDDEVGNRRCHLRVGTLALHVPRVARQENQEAELGVLFVIQK